MSGRSQARRDPGRREPRAADRGRDGSRGDAARGGMQVALAAPLVAFVGLVVAAVLSVSLFSLTGSAAGGQPPGDPLVPNPGSSPGGPLGPIRQRTPDPSVVVTPQPEQQVEVRGTILFARTGNIWAASGRALQQVSNKGTDSSPVWAPDGSRIYFIETRTRVADSPYQGRTSTYTLEYPVIMSMAPDGSDRREVESGLFKPTSGTHWFYWLLQPDISPDGRTIALVSDAPDGTGDITLATLPTAGGTVRKLGVRSIRGLGHNDPAWSPDGGRIAFTYNQRNGNLGTPRIGIYDLDTKQVRLLRGTGYAAPSWSPDGRLIAAERTRGDGRDVVILDAESGAEVARVTNDGRSFSPTFAPDGTQIAYLRLDGLFVDLRIVTFDTSTNTLLEDKAITEHDIVDSGSPPSWFMPAEVRATPAPTPPSVEATGSIAPESAAP